MMNGIKKTYQFNGKEYDRINELALALMSAPADAPIRALNTKRTKQALLEAIADNLADFDDLFAQGMDEKQNALVKLFCSPRYFRLKVRAFGKTESSRELMKMAKVAGALKAIRAEPALPPERTLPLHPPNVRRVTRGEAYFNRARAYFMSGLDNAAALRDFKMAALFNLSKANADYLAGDQVKTLNAQVTCDCGLKAVRLAFENKVSDEDIRHLLVPVMNELRQLRGKLETTDMSESAHENVTLAETVRQWLEEQDCSIMIKLHAFDAGLLKEMIECLSLKSVLTLQNKLDRCGSQDFIQTVDGWYEGLCESRGRKRQAAKVLASAKQGDAGIEKSSGCWARFFSRGKKENNATPGDVIKKKI